MLSGEYEPDGKKFNEEECISTLRILSGGEKLEEMPHKDSLNYYLEKLSPECLAGLRKRMIAKLLRNKTFHKHRLLKKKWRIILDGTGFFINNVEETAGKKETANLYGYKFKEKMGKKKKSVICG